MNKLKIVGAALLVWVLHFTFFAPKPIPVSPTFKKASEDYIARSRLVSSVKSVAPQEQESLPAPELPPSNAPVIKKSGHSEPDVIKNAVDTAPRLPAAKIAKATEKVPVVKKETVPIRELLYIKCGDLLLRYHLTGDSDQIAQIDSRLRAKRNRITSHFATDLKSSTADEIVWVRPFAHDDVNLNIQNMQELKIACLDASSDDASLGDPNKPRQICQVGVLVDYWQIPSAKRADASCAFNKSVRALRTSVPEKEVFIAYNSAPVSAPGPQ